MKFSYRLKRVCGSVYSNGNLCFTPDGQSIISPVGNRVNVFDLVNQSSDALPLESRKDVSLIAISHNGMFLIVIDADGAAIFYNFPRRVVLHKLHFRQKVLDIRFSPDDRHFAITYNRGCQIWTTPSSVKEFCPLVLSRTIGGHADETVCLDWSPDSRSLILGSRDLTARVYYKAVTKRMALSVLAGHRDALVGAYFGTSEEVAFTVAADGGLFSWAFDQDQQAQAQAADGTSSEEESSDEEVEGEEVLHRGAAADKLKLKLPKPRQGRWKLTERRLLRDGQGGVTACDYNRPAQLLLLGFERGVFALYEMPDCTNLQRISVSSAALSTVRLSPSGDWLAIGGREHGQLLVWEWRSESYVLRQQGHLYGLNAVDYSADGQLMASGGEDGKVKLWAAASGYCTVTFAVHTAPVTGVHFVGSGRAQALLSSSLDGTVRAHDLLRYKCFRTLTTPSPAQLTCLSADSSGEIVCAGAMEPFSIYVWALQTGRLLEVLAGHEGPIACLALAPPSTSSGTSLLLSGSWDGTAKLWDIYGHACVETFAHGCDVLGLGFRPDGREFCTATTSGALTVWDVESGAQLRQMEGKQDLSVKGGGGVFTSLAYSSDGSCVLAAGRGKHVCIYSADSGVLVKRYQLSHNRDMANALDVQRSDGVVDGVTLADLDDTSEEVQAKRTRSAIGVSKGVRAELMAAAVRFSPSGGEWAVASTAGLQVYALDEGLLFAPVDLDTACTPQGVYLAIGSHQHAAAINMALQLGEAAVLEAAVSSVPLEGVALVCRTLIRDLLPRLLRFLAEQLLCSHSLGFYLAWTVAVLREHGHYLGGAGLQAKDALRALLRGCSVHDKELLRVAEANLFACSYLRGKMQRTQDRIRDLEQMLAEAEAAEGEDEEVYEEEGAGDEGSYVVEGEHSLGGAEDGAVPWTISHSAGGGGAWASAWNEDEEEGEEEDALPGILKQMQREEEEEQKETMTKKKKKSRKTAPASAAVAPEEVQRPMAGKRTRSASSKAAAGGIGTGGQ